MNSLTQIHHYLPLMQSLYSSDPSSLSKEQLISLLFSKEKTLIDFNTIYLYLKNIFPSIDNTTTLQVLSLALKFTSIPPLSTLYKYGDKKTSIYFIISGECSVLSPYEEKSKLTEEEYILYLTKLFYYDEMALLETTIRTNRGLFDIHSPYHFEKVIERYLDKYTKNSMHKDSVKILSFSDIIDKNSIIGEKFISFFVSWLYYTYTNRDDKKTNFISTDEYQDRITPVMIEYDTKEENERATKYLRKKCSLYRYKLVKSLCKGDRCNETFTLSSSRSSTIITEKNTIIGYLTEDFFSLPTIKTSFIIGKSGNTSLISSHPIFNGIQSFMFDKLYMKFFEFHIGDKGAFLISEGDQCSYVYFIKRGTYEITFHNERIGYVERNEVIGCDDYIGKDGESYVFSVRMISDRGEYFAIKYSDMKKICEEDENVNKHYMNYISQKKDFFMEKIKGIMFKKKHLNEVKQSDSMRIIHLPKLKGKNKKSHSPQDKPMHRTICKTFTLLKKLRDESNEHKIINTSYLNIDINKVFSQPQSNSKPKTNSTLQLSSSHNKIQFKITPRVYLQKKVSSFKDETTSTKETLSNTISGVSSQRNIRPERNKVIPILDMSKLTLENITFREKKNHRSPPCRSHQIRLCIKPE